MGIQTEQRITDKSLKWWADNGRDLELRWMARELQERRTEQAQIERMREALRELVDASVEEFGPSRYNTAMNKARAVLERE